MRIAFRAFALVVGIGAAVAAAQSPPSGDNILDALRGGGYVILLRHGATHADQADTDPLHLENMAQQRQLNDKGRSQTQAASRAPSTRRAPRVERSRRPPTTSRKAGWS